MGIDHNLQQRLDAYVAGNCSPRALSDELLAHCAASPRAAWEVLALLDQYHRRGKLPHDLHRSISQSIERRALGVQAAALQADMERPDAKVAAVASIAVVPAPTGEVLVLRKELQATRALAAAYLEQLKSQAWERPATVTPPQAPAVRQAPRRWRWRWPSRWRWRAVPAASMALLLLAILASQRVGERETGLPVPRTPPLPVPVPAHAAAPGRLSLASDTIIVQPGNRMAAITVTRSGGADGAISFLWWTQSAGARAGRDFRAHLPRRVSMPAGAQSLQLSVPILDNPERRHTELFYVVIGQPRGGAELGAPRRATVFILRR